MPKYLRVQKCWKFFNVSTYIRDPNAKKRGFYLNFKYLLDTHYGYLPFLFQDKTIFSKISKKAQNQFCPLNTVPAVSFASFDNC